MQVEPHDGVRRGPGPGEEVQERWPPGLSARKNRRIVLDSVQRLRVGKAPTRNQLRQNPRFRSFRRCAKVRSTHASVWGCRRRRASSQGRSRPWRGSVTVMVPIGDVRDCARLKVLDRSFLLTRTNPSRQFRRSTLGVSPHSISVPSGLTGQTGRVCLPARSQSVYRHGLRHWSPMEWIVLD